VWQEAGDAAALPPGQTTAGAGGLLRIFGSVRDTIDADLYAIRITDPPNFSATTAGGVDEDTQIFLFDAAGNGLAFNDDRPAVSTVFSRLTNAYVPAGGNYYLGVSEFSRNPVSPGGFIWLADPAYEERIPDGPGLAGPLTGWSGIASSSGGDYGVVLTGAEFALGNAAVEDASSQRSLVRLAAHPSPFHGSVTIVYSIPTAGPARLRVLDLRGTVVRTLLDERRADASRSLRWDGRDERGADLGAGVYVIQLEAGPATATRKVVRMR
jgi:hypothetical protein